MENSGKNYKIRQNPVSWGLVLSFLLSFVTLLVYLSESDFTDETIFFLLSVIRYSAFFVAACSAYLLITVLRHLKDRPCALSILGIVLFLCSFLYGAGITIINVFIVTIAGGM
ncbi:MAG: hypothetical protein LBH44_11890 [Treponema sp.]|jgi:hypothetical protein|nr:hypothetical protein [Treponema sp.]